MQYCPMLHRSNVSTLSIYWMGQTVAYDAAVKSYGDVDNKDLEHSAWIASKLRIMKDKTNTNKRPVVPADDPKLIEQLWVILDGFEMEDIAAQLSILDQMAARYYESDSGWWELNIKFQAKYEFNLFWNLNSVNMSSVLKEGFYIVRHFLLTKYKHIVGYTRVALRPIFSRVNFDKEIDSKARDILNDNIDFE